MAFHIDIVYILSGLGVGVLVGLTGVGGGSLMTPLLTAVFGVPAMTAVGTDLAFAAITKGVGTLIHRIKCNINWRVVALLAAGSLPASILTTLILHSFDVHGAGPKSSIDLFMRWSIAVCVLMTVAALLFKTKILTWLEKNPRYQAQGKVLTISTLGAGVTIGVLVTLSSIGAGAIGAVFLIVLYPSLRSAEIAGTDIAHAVPLTAVAAIGHLSLGTLDFSLLGALLLGSIPGIAIGSSLSRSVPEKLLRGVLATTLTVVAVKLVM